MAEVRDDGRVFEVKERYICSVILNIYLYPHIFTSIVSTRVKNNLEQKMNAVSVCILLTVVKTNHISR